MSRSTGPVSGANPPYREQYGYCTYSGQTLTGGGPGPVQVMTGGGFTTTDANWFTFSSNAITVHRTGMYRIDGFLAHSAVTTSGGGVVGPRKNGTLIAGMAYTDNCQSNTNAYHVFGPRGAVEAQLLVAGDAIDMTHQMAVSEAPSTTSGQLRLTFVPTLAYPGN